MTRHRMWRETDVRATSPKPSRAGMAILAWLDVAPFHADALGLTEGAAFNRLVDDGYVVFGNVKGRLCYSITSKGRKAIAAQRNES